MQRQIADTRNAALAAAVVALVVRLGVSAAYKSHMSVGPPAATPRSEAYYIRTASIELTDSQQYLLLSENLRRHAFFSWDGVTPVTFRTPGYPLLLALVGSNMTMVVIVQSLLGALTVLLVYAVGRCWFGDRAGLLAAVTAGADLPAIAHTGVVMSETLFVFLVVLSLWTFARWTVLNRSCGGQSARSGSWWLAGSGLLLGLAALVRPIALFGFLPFAAVLASCMPFESMRGVSSGRRWGWLGIMLAAFSILPAAWAARNYLHYRRVAFTSLAGYNLFYYNAAAMEADRRGVSFPEARVLLEKSFASSLEGDNPLELANRLAAEGVRRMAADPLRYGKVYLRGLAQIAFGVKSDEIVLRIADPHMGLATTWRMMENPQLGTGAKVATVLLAVVELCMTGGALLLAFVSAFRRRGPALILFVLGMYYIILAAPLPDGRFRIPAMPFLYLAAAALVSQQQSGERTSILKAGTDGYSSSDSDSGTS